MKNVLTCTAALPPHQYTAAHAARRRRRAASPPPLHATAGKKAAQVVNPVNPALLRPRQGAAPAGCSCFITATTWGPILAAHAAALSQRVCSGQCARKAGGGETRVSPLALPALGDPGVQFVRALLCPVAPLPPLLRSSRIPSPDQSKAEPGARALQTQDNSRPQKDAPAGWRQGYAFIAWSGSRRVRAA